MSILVTLVARKAPLVPAVPLQVLKHKVTPYYLLREQIRESEIRSRTTSSATSAGGLDYDKDDNDHRP
jgi:hypothetical protein